MNITKEIEDKCDELILQYPKKKSAAMMIMHLFQETFGYFDDEAIRFVAKKLEIEPIEVYGILSFYPMFTQKPRGRVHIKVCKTLSCAVAGSVKLGNDLAKIVESDDTGLKDIFTIEFVECLGNCVKGPVVQVNDQLFENVKAEDAQKFLDKLKTMDSAGELNASSCFDKPASADSIEKFKG